MLVYRYYKTCKIKSDGGKVSTPKTFHDWRLVCVRCALRGERWDKPSPGSTGRTWNRAMATAVVHWDFGVGHTANTLRLLVKHPVNHRPTSVPLRQTNLPKKETQYHRPNRTKTKKYWCPWPRGAESVLSQQLRKRPFSSRHHGWIHANVRPPAWNVCQMRTTPKPRSARVDREESRWCLSRIRAFCVQASHNWASLESSQSDKRVSWTRVFLVTATPAPSAVAILCAENESSAYQERNCCRTGSERLCWWRGCRRNFKSTLTHIMSGEEEKTEEE